MIDLPAEQTKWQRILDENGGCPACGGKQACWITERVDMDRIAIRVACETSTCALTSEQIIDRYELSMAREPRELVAQAMRVNIAAIEHAASGTKADEELADFVETRVAERSNETESNIYGQF